MGECALAERLESRLAKYVAKGKESDNKDSLKLIYGIANCNELNRGPQIINYNISISIFIENQSILGIN